jgi:hypothetical protein
MRSRLAGEVAQHQPLLSGRHRLAHGSFTGFHSVGDQEEEPVPGVVVRIAVGQTPKRRRQPTRRLGHPENRRQTLTTKLDR